MAAIASDSLDTRRSKSSESQRESEELSAIELEDTSNILIKLFIYPSQNTCFLASDSMIGPENEEIEISNCLNDSIVSLQIFSSLILLLF